MDGIKEPNAFTRKRAERLASFPARTAAIAFFVWALVIGCSSVTRTVIVPPDIEGASYVGNAACSECHEPITRLFPASPHARFFRNTPDGRGVSGCESCHGPGSKHVQAGGGRGVFIRNPRQDPSSCLVCHREVEAEFRLPFHHPAMEGHLNCVACHDPHGRDAFKPARGLAFARLNDSCSPCHREQTRPFVFEHEAMRSGCTACHQPHGSVNDKLLVLRDSNLCLRCHSQMQFFSNRLFIGKEDHTLHLQAGACWTSGCHNAVHGSMVSTSLRY